MHDNNFEDDHFTISLIDDCIINIQIKDFKELEKEDIIKMQAWITGNNLKTKLYNLAIFGNGSSATREAREYASSKEGNTLTFGTAIVVKNFAQQLILDYYIKFNNPVHPTRVFLRKEKALDWIKKQMEKN